MNDEEPFLKRWSRRKIEAKDGPDAADPKPAADAAPARAPKKPATPQRPVVLVITKKIIETTAASSGPARTTSGAAPINYVYAPAPASAPVTVSCGTHPC